LKPILYINGVALAGLSYSYATAMRTMRLPAATVTRLFEAAPEYEVKIEAIGRVEWL
jgi:hypothetical protein